MWRRLVSQMKRASAITAITFSGCARARTEKRRSAACRNFREQTRPQQGSETICPDRFDAHAATLTSGFDRQHWVSH